MEEAETTEQEQKEKGTAEHIKQRNIEKQGKSREKGEEQEKTLDASEYTELQPQKDYKNQQTKTRIENQNEVEIVDKENLKIGKQKPYQKTLYPINTCNKEENNSEIQ